MEDEVFVLNYRHNQQIIVGKITLFGNHKLNKEIIQNLSSGDYSISVNIINHDEEKIIRDFSIIKDVKDD